MTPRTPIDLKVIFNTLWVNKKLIIKATIISLIIVGIYVFSLPRTYTSTLKLAPEVQNSSGMAGGLGSLASMVGISLSGASEDAFYPEIYPELIRSNQFLGEMFHTQVKSADGKIQTNLGSYLKSHQKFAWWIYLISPVKKFFNSLTQGTQQRGAQDTLNTFWLTREQSKIFEFLAGCITCQVDKKTSVVTLGFSAQDPYIAATMADTLRVKLQEYIINYRTKKAQVDLQFAEELYQETAKKYEKASEVYARFTDTHRDLSLNKYLQEQTALENEMQLSYTMFSQASQQLQLAKAKLQERTPSFTVLSMASVPVKPSAPKRIITLLITMLLTVGGCSAYIYAKHLAKE